MSNEVEMVSKPPAEQPVDTFRGDNQHLISCIKALLALDAKGALIPHGIGGHARELLSSAAARLGEQHPGEPVVLPGRYVHEHHGCFLSERKHGWNACLDEIAKLGPLYTHPAPAVQKGERVGEVVAFGEGLHEIAWVSGRIPGLGAVLYTRADAGEVERLQRQVKNAELALKVQTQNCDALREENKRMASACGQTLEEMSSCEAENERLCAQLAERDAALDALNEIATGYKRGLVKADYVIDHARTIDEQAFALGTQNVDPGLFRGLGNLLEQYDDDALSASAEPSAPKCKGWTCFHCDEHFTDADSASIHFGTHEIQRPACLIDAAEYRSMEERVRECANEDSKLHRQLRRQASNHKLELQRAEEGGYAKGLADASAPVERDERAAYDAWRHSESGYVRPFDRHEWSAWQARAALERKP